LNSIWEGLLKMGDLKTHMERDRVEPAKALEKQPPNYGFHWTKVSSGAKRVKHCEKGCREYANPKIHSRHGPARPSAQLVPQSFSTGTGTGYPWNCK